MHAMGIFTEDDQDRLHNILKHPQLLEGGYVQKDQDEPEYYGARPKRFTRNIVERGNLRLRLRNDNRQMSVYVKVKRHHKGWFLRYDYDEWVYIGFLEDHPVWDVVRRVMPELEDEIKRAVDPPATLEPSGALPIVEDQAPAKKPKSKRDG